MVTHYFKTLKDTALKTYPEPRAGVWTNVIAPTDSELSELVDEFGLDAAIVNDIKDFFEVPRFERSGSASYFFARYPYEETAEDIDTAPLLIVIGASFVVTIAQREVPFLAPFISGQVNFYTTQKTKFFLEIMLALTAQYEQELMRIRKQVYSDRTRIKSIRASDIQRLVSYEHKLNDMTNAVVPTNAWLQQLAKGNYIQLYKDDLELMEDLTIANSQLIDSAYSILKTIQNVRGANEAILTQNLNNTIKLLTALTIIITIPTVISSLYGMNVRLPLAEQGDAFWIILVLIVAVMALAAYYFFTKRWL